MGGHLAIFTPPLRRVRGEWGGCNLFLGTCLHNACMTVVHVHDMFTIIHLNHCATPWLKTSLHSLPPRDHKCSNVDPGLPQYGDCYLKVVAEPVPLPSSDKLVQQLFLASAPKFGLAKATCRSHPNRCYGLNPQHGLRRRASSNCLI